MRAKELEEDLVQVTGQRDTLNVQIGRAFLHVETLAREVEAQKAIVRERDEALSGMGREIEMLRAVIHDKDEALKASEKTLSVLRDKVLGWKTHADGEFSIDFY